MRNWHYKCYIREFESRNWKSGPVDFFGKFLWINLPFTIANENFKEEFNGFNFPSLDYQESSVFDNGEIKCIHLNRLASNIYFKEESLHWSGSHLFRDWDFGRMNFWS